jgi:hypothetical protein
VFRKTDITSNDIVVLAVDNNGSDTASDQMFLVANDCAIIGCQLYMTTYYCFESWILTFADLLTWSQCFKIDYHELLNYALKGIRGEIELVAIEIPNAPKTSSRGRTNEHFYVDTF